MDADSKSKTYDVVPLSTRYRLVTVLLRGSSLQVFIDRYLTVQYLYIIVAGRLTSVKTFFPTPSNGHDKGKLRKRTANNVQGRSVTVMDNKESLTLVTKMVMFLGSPLATFIVTVYNLENLKLKS